ncbi:zinc finger and BTB domain-containing protein 4 [Pterocles gutturalis]
MAPVVEVSDAGHCRSLLVELNEQRLRGQFCDVTIIAEDTKFRAHKNVLAASSPFFRQALSQGPAASPSPAQVLELPGVQAGVFSDVLNFIYNSRLALPSPAAARELGAVGRRLGISCLQGLESGTPKEMNGSWSPPAAGEPRSPAAPVDLTCPPRASETPAVAEPVTAAAASASAPPSSLRCGLCGRGFGTAAALGFHAKLHRGRRGLACRHCGKSFIHVKRLQTHEVLCKDGQRDAANANAAAAPKQGKKALLLRHRALELVPEQEAVVKVVDGQVVYLCGVCHRSYMTLSSLKRHANVHSWRRKYPCRYCDKVFALAEYRTKHEVWHTGERRYQCIFCWDTFVTYYNLKTHQKTFHGINPALISSEKTPNGGYKPKLNALKLYRLLPMRAHKRPYKTYSQGLVADGLLLPDAAVTEPPPPAGTFPAPPRPEPASVIAYGRPAPSVIVHSGAAPSVIAYNGRAGDAAAAPASPARPMKKQVLRDYIEAQRAAGTAPAGDNAAAPTAQPPSPGTQPASPNAQLASPNTQLASPTTQPVSPTAQPPSPGGVTGVTGRTMTYVAKPATGEKRAAPLCQITVRIGEEAIVKRRISEDELRREDSAASPVAQRRGGVTGGSRRSGDDDSDAEDRLWRPYYSYKPKRKATGATAGAKASRWRRKLRPPRWPPGDGDAADVTASRPLGDAPRSWEWPHACRVCGKSFSALRKLRKHQRGHEGPGDGGGGDAVTSGDGDTGGVPAAIPRVGRRPSLRFSCPRCAKVCKTAAALGRHAQRHRDVTSPVTSSPPPPVTSSPPPGGVACGVKEEEERGGGGEKGGAAPPPPAGGDVTSPAGAAAVTSSPAAVTSSPAAVTSSPGGVFPNVGGTP